MRSPAKRLLFAALLGARLVGFLFILLSARVALAHRLLVLRPGSVAAYEAERSPAPDAPPIPGLLRWNHALMDTFATYDPPTSAHRMVFGPQGDLYVSVQGGILRFDEAGSFIERFVEDGEPQGMTFGPDGNLYVADDYYDAVFQYDVTAGALIRRFDPPGNGLTDPVDLAFGPAGDLYVTSREVGGGAIRRFQTGTGYYMGYLVPPGIAGLGRPSALAFDSSDADSLYVTDENDGRVLLFSGLDGAFLRELVPAYSLGGRGGILLIPDDRLYAGSMYVWDRSQGLVCINRRDGAYLGGPNNFINGISVLLYTSFPTDFSVPQGGAPELQLSPDYSRS